MYILLPVHVLQFKTICWGQTDSDLGKETKSFPDDDSRLEV